MHTPNPSNSGLTTRIALLAMLAVRPMHGYEVRQMLEKRRMHLWANIQYGSIYRGLQQLSREGLVGESGEERAGKRPTRTIYHITDAGRESLKTLLRQAWREPEMAANSVDLALSLHLILPKEEVLELIDARQQVLSDMAQSVTTMRSEVEGHLHQQPAAIRNRVSDLFYHRQLLIETEQTWTDYIRKRMENGAYDLSDEGRARLEKFHHGEPVEEAESADTSDLTSAERPHSN
jgi:DNA-binding PadR family transcriptional regulator